MKQKLSLLLLALISTLGAWAQDVVDGTHVYTISTKDRGSWVVPNGSPALTSTQKAGLAFLATDVKQQFAFVTVGDKQYLYSVSAKKFVSKSGSYTAFGWTGDPVSIIASSGDANFPSVIQLSGSYQLGISNSYDYGVISFWNDISDEGNRVKIAAVEDVVFDDSEAQAVFATDAKVTATQNTLDEIGVFALQSKYGVSGSDKIYTESSDAEEGNVPALLDNSYNTFHHSDWHDAAATPHWITYEVSDVTDAIRFYIKQRSNGTGRPTDVTVSASNDNSNFTEITRVYPSWSGSPSDTYSEAIAASESYKYWRLTVNATSSNTNSWFCASELYVLPNNPAVDAFFTAMLALRSSSSSAADIDAAQTLANSIETLMGTNTITYTAYNILTNGEIGSGSQDVSSTFSAPVVDGYVFKYAKDTNDNDVDITTQTYDANTTLKLYYLPSLTNINNVSATGVYTFEASRGYWYDNGEVASGGNTIGRYAFVTYEGNTYLYSLGSEKFMCHEISSGVNSNNNRIQMQNTNLSMLATGFTLAATGIDNYPVSMSDGNGYMFNVGGAGQLVLNTWKNLDAGNQLRIAQVADDFDNTAALAALEEYFHPAVETVYAEAIAALEAINFGTGLNQYSFTGEYAGSTSQAATIIAGLKNQGYTEENLTNAQELLANYALNMPGAGFYRIKGNTSGKYLASGFVTVNNQQKFAMSEATDATTIFYFDGAKLVNYGSGMSNGMTSNAWAWVTEDGASAVVFQDGLTNGGYGIKSATCNFYDNGDNSNSADRGNNVTIQTSTNARYTSWYLEEVTTLPVTVTEAGYATLYAPVALTIPEGVTAYTGVINGEWFSMTKIDGEAIPAETAVVLKADAGTYNFDITTAESLNRANTLNGTIGGIANAAGKYVLAEVDGEAGFYRVNDTNPALAGFKAYLEVENAPEVKGFTFVFGDDATGINEVNGQWSMVNGQSIFNLAGQRIQKMQKGVNIVNGKKILK